MPNLASPACLVRLSPLANAKTRKKSGMSSLLGGAAICAVLAGCGGGGGQATPSESGTQTVSGTLSGLAENTSALAQGGITSTPVGLMLTATEGANVLDFSSLTLGTTDSSFKFSMAMPKGASYTVSVKTQPAGQYCTVSNGTGTVSDQAISNVAVSCVIASHDVSTKGVPKFVANNYIDLTQTSNGSPLINAISMFRSSEGHSYADGLETCRSMKHYFKNPDAATKIYAPVTGTVTKVAAESATGAGGTQIWITSEAYPAFTFKLFHVNPGKTYTAGNKVSAGEQLGTHIGTSTWSDIAVMAITSPVISKTSVRNVSYFETLTDSAFLPFKNRGIATPQALIHSQAVRDANPLTCDGETFTNAGSDPLAKAVSF